MNKEKQIQWQSLLKRQKEHVQRVRTWEKQYEERMQHLLRMKQMLIRHEAEWVKALKDDLGKSDVESYTSEIAVLLNEIDYVLKHLKEWMTPEKTSRFMIGAVEKAAVFSLPYGSALVISPWNYPLQLSLMPVIGALAGGNSCFLKPSEKTPQTSRLLHHLVGRYFYKEVLTVVEGDGDISASLLELEWDMLFFTGSKKVGQIIHEKAAEKRIPVVLELGGKNPCIVTPSGFSKAAVKRVIWGKFLNAGQTCIVPDTVYVHHAVFDSFLETAKEVIQEFYGKDPQSSNDYGRLVSQDHFDQVISYLEDGFIWHGGESSREDLYLEPTVLIGMTDSSRVMQEEIFGPILPVVSFENLSELADQLNKLPSPLATYFFSDNQEQGLELSQRMKSGAFSFNQVIRHGAVPHLPFGGIGASGIGRYHGKTSFDAFTYQKPFYTQKEGLGSSFQYPPYPADQMHWIRRLRRWLI